MRNIFDQYKQPENKLTHALASTLAHDRKLLGPFLRWLGIDSIPANQVLHITEQQIPGDFDPEGELEAKGVPDMCIFKDESWAVLFESKIQSKVYIPQLERHLNTAKNHGYDVAALIVIAVDPVKGKLPKSARQVQWRDVYAWFRGKADQSFWAMQLVQYMQVFENQMIAKNYNIRGTITMFDGLHFDSDNPFTYIEGKRLIRLLGDQLQCRKDLHKIGIDPKGKRRGAITGSRGDRVWDFLPLRKSRRSKQFTDFPHLTIGISRHNAGAGITVPNGVKGGFRGRIIKAGIGGFRALMREVRSNAATVLRDSEGSKISAQVVQRHYPSQRSTGIEDGRLEVDLHTLVKRKRTGVKEQPEWIDAIYELLANKRSNIQFGVGVQFSYDCPRIRSSQAEDLFARSLIAMSPVLDFVLD